MFKIFIYICYFLYLSLPIGFLILTFVVALIRPSFVLMLVVMVILQHGTRNSYIWFGIVSMIECLTIYLAQFISLLLNLAFPDLVE